MSYQTINTRHILGQTTPTTQVGVVDAARAWLAARSYYTHLPLSLNSFWIIWEWVRLGKRTLYVSSRDLASGLNEAKLELSHSPSPDKLFGRVFSVALPGDFGGVDPFIVMKAHATSGDNPLRFDEFVTAVLGQPAKSNTVGDQDYIGIMNRRIGSTTSLSPAEWRMLSVNAESFISWNNKRTDEYRNAIGVPRKSSDEEIYDYHLSLYRGAKFLSAICAYHSAFPDRLIDGPPADITSPLKDASYKTLGPPPPQANRGGTHASPDAHYRRWHFRELRNDRFERNADGTPKIVLVRDCYVKPDSAKTLIGHEPR